MKEIILTYREICAIKELADKHFNENVVISAESTPIGDAIYMCLQEELPSPNWQDITDYEAL